MFLAPFSRLYAFFKVHKSPEAGSHHKGGALEAHDPYDRTIDMKKRVDLCGLQGSVVGINTISCMTKRPALLAFDLR